MNAYEGPQRGDVKALRMVNAALRFETYPAGAYEALAHGAGVTVHKLKRLVGTLGLLTIMSGEFKITQRGRGCTAMTSKTPSRKQLNEVDEMISRAKVLQQEVQEGLASVRALHERHREQTAIVTAKLAEHKALSVEIQRLSDEQDRLERESRSALDEAKRVTAESDATMRVVDEKIAEHRALTAAVDARLKGMEPS